MAKKDFSTNAGVVEQFLSIPAQNAPQEAPEGPKEQKADGTQTPQAEGKAPIKKRKKRTPQAEYATPYTERFTRRVQLVFPPSLYEKVKAQARTKGQSFNGYIIELLVREVLGN